MASAALRTLEAFDLSYVDCRSEEKAVATGADVLGEVCGLIPCSSANDLSLPWSYRFSKQIRE